MHTRTEASFPPPEMSMTLAAADAQGIAAQSVGFMPYRYGPTAGVLLVLVANEVTRKLLTEIVRNEVEVYEHNLAVAVEGTDDHARASSELSAARLLLESLTKNVPPAPGFIQVVQ